MVKESEAIRKRRADVVKKEEGTIEYSLLLLLLLLVFSRFSSTLTWGAGGRRACAVLVLRDAACEVICRELFQHFRPGL